MSCFSSLDRVTANFKSGIGWRSAASGLVEDILRRVADAMIYQIHHYPAELIDLVHLRDSERVVVRPILPQDQELLIAFFHDLR